MEMCDDWTQTLYLTLFGISGRLQELTPISHCMC